MQPRSWYKNTLSFFADTWNHWRFFRPTRMAASLSYYAVFALVPLLVITFWVGTLILHSQTLEPDIISRVVYVIGPASLGFLQTTFNGTLSVGNHPITSIITILILLFFAVTGFDELKQCIDELWEVPREMKPGFFSVVSRYFVSLLAMVVFGVALVAFIIIAKFFQAGLGHDIDTAGRWITTVGGPVVVFVITMIGTFLTYVVLPSRPMPKKHLIVGAAITGIFLTVGNIVIGYYLAFGATLSAYGVAGSIIAVLLWFYYSSLIFLFGACATWIYDRRQIKISDMRAGIK